MTEPSGTRIVAYSSLDLPENHPRRRLRDLTQAEFIQQYGSGTLRKSHSLGFDVRETYLQERVRLEYGQGFELIQRSRLVYQDPKLTACQGITELCWHLERMITLRPFDSDVFVPKYLEVTYADDSVKHSYGIFVHYTSAKWIPPGYIAIAHVAPVLNGQIKAANNPF